jgi:alkylation response protein AidB-like acyl-CoA dehydrogenase
MFIPLVLSDEHSALQKTVQQLFEKRAAETDLRRTIDSELGYDTDLWKQMSAIGLPSLAIPEEFGGAGYGPIETFLTFREMGRVLLAAPFFATVALAANVLLATGTDEAKQQYLPQIAAGDLLATVALCEEHGSWKPADVTLTATASDGGYTLTGTKYYVIDAQVAQLILVVARTEAGLSVLAVDRDAAGLSVAPLTTLDLTRRQGHVSFDNAPATLVSTGSDAAAGLATALDAASLALVAEQIGGGEQLMSAALEYAKIRYQFGRAIGSFQAIKHKLAEDVFDVERMVSAGWHAAQTAATGEPGAFNALHLAKAFCSEAYFRLAADNIQVHGGIGFTWEHSAHLYFRRAKSSELVLGSPKEHRELLLTSLIS